MNGRELEAAHRELVRDVMRNGFGGTCRGSKGDIAGRVPAWVLPRLTSMAARIGYPVHYGPPEWDTPATSLGSTRTYQTVSRSTGKIGRTDPDSIRLTPGMTDVSRARVLAHELAHAVNHVAAGRSGQRISSGTDDEEAMAESAAALVCEALRLPGRECSLDYLAGYCQGDVRLLRQTGPEGIRRAGVILRAIA